MTRPRIYSSLHRPRPALLAGLGGALASGALGALALALPLAIVQAGHGAVAVAVLVALLALVGATVTPTESP